MNDKYKDRFKHLIACFIIGLVFNLETALVSLVCVEWRGGYWDWIDILFGAIGALMGAVVRSVIGGRFALLFNLF